MRTIAAQLAHDISSAVALGLATGLVLCGCSPSIPQPLGAPVDAHDYGEVTSSPRAPPVEFIPSRPRKDAVWVDGSWEYDNGRFGWRSGTWTVAPKGLRRARWVVVRREEDGQLFFAHSTWKDAGGKNVDDSGWIHALGPQARGRARLGGPPPFDEPPRRREGRPARREPQREPQGEPLEKPKEEVAPAGEELR